MDRYSVYEKFKKTLFSKIQNRNKLLKYKEYFRFNKDIELLSVYRNARKWIYANTVPGKGIRPSVGLDDTKTDIAYPEVSGYYIPSLLHYGFRDLAKQYAKWLLSIQHEEGAWYDYLDKAPYVFDTGQILKGLIAIYPIMPEVKDSILKGCDYILSQIRPDGQLPSPSLEFWPEGICTELIHLYCLKPLIDAARIFGCSRYETEARRVLAYYKENSMDKLLDFHTLSHFYAYMMEALVDLGETEIARKLYDAASYHAGAVGAYAGKPAFGHAAQKRAAQRGYVVAHRAPALFAAGGALVLRKHLPRGGHAHPLYESAAYVKTDIILHTSLSGRSGRRPREGASAFAAAARTTKKYSL